MTYADAPSLDVKRGHLNMRQDHDIGSPRRTAAAVDAALGYASVCFRILGRRRRVTGPTAWGRAGAIFVFISL